MNRVVLLLNNAPEVRNNIRKWYSEIEQSGNQPIVIAENGGFMKRILGDVKIEYCFTSYLDSIPKNRKHNLFVNVDLKRLKIWESYYADFERDIHFGNRTDYHYLEQTLIHLYNFFYSIFSKEKPVAVFYENVSNTFAYAAFNVTRLLNIKYLGVTMARIPGRIYLHSSIYDDSYGYLKIFDEAENNNYRLMDDEFEYLHSFLSNFTSSSPDYMKSNNLGLDISNFRYLRKSKLQYLYNTLLYDFSRIGKYPGLQSKNLFKSAILTFLKNVRRKLVVRYLDIMYYCNIDEEDSYYLYPLHFHPESSTSVISRPYAKELEIIQNIAFSLPFGTKLYVKDHPSAAGFMDIDFYRQIAQIPNVKLISHKARTKRMIKDCLAVITLTSTVGFEALIMNKKVFVFGNTFYEMHPNCVKIVDLTNLFEYFSDINVKPYSPFNTVYAYYKQTYAKDLNISNFL
ncbi:capsular polysaccharide export protein, LipB/KpsS family [Jiulongibacter sp. NS-SX5]|uniref:capsular polysaccharide export protein, LipB/KpsS family n=1 Tax=Jiulongibacter sp. NS-SX5 TaxID=3463854 RepID=UPI004059B352